MPKNKFLILENGRTFEGKSFGFDGETTAEIVFTTGMTGYLETLTDKSYYGQIVTQTFPLIGNYGVIPSDFEGEKPSLSGYIVQNFCQEPSNFRNEGNIDEYLRKNKIVGICCINTRTLTKIIREYGVMNGAIIDNPKHFDINQLKMYKIDKAVENVTTPKKYTVKSQNSQFSVALWDFGLKQNIIRELNERNCDVTVFPSSATADEILHEHLDGLMLSNGPGNPADNVEIVENLRKIAASKIPTFGICLGHQLLALAHNISTYKLKYGHRGANQPAKNVITGKVYITSQNHGYAADTSNLPQNVKPLFVNVNDNTCEGLIYRDSPIFSTQFHPEASAGPHDTAFLFDDFIDMMKRRKNA